MMPMGTVYVDRHGNATERCFGLLRERAKGGIGININEYTGVDEIDSIPTVGNLRAASDYNLSSLEHHYERGT